jgi:hypothetical protein
MPCAVSWQVWNGRSQRLASSATDPCGLAELWTHPTDCSRGNNWTKCLHAR